MATETEQLLENALKTLLEQQATALTTLSARLDNLERENQEIRTQYKQISEQLATLTSSINILNR